MNRQAMIDLQRQIDALREVGDDYLIISVGARGPNVDCRNGNAVATVSMGDDTSTAEALYLPDAIALARGAILRERAAREKKRQAAADDLKTRSKEG